MEIKRDRFRKTIVSPFTGQEYIVRRIDMRDYLQAIGILPIVIAQPVQHQLEKLNAELKSRQETSNNYNDDTERATREYVLKKGVIEPKIWFGLDSECPENAIAFADMGNDVMFVAGEICAFWTQWQPEKFFPDAGSVAARPDGEAVRSETVRVDA